MSARDKAEYARMFQEKAVIEKRQMAIERRAGSPARGAAGAVESAAGSAVGVATGGGASPSTRVLTLNHDEHQESTLYRFEKGDVVQFCPGPSLLGRQVFLYTNYVNTENQEEAEFVRNQYYLLQWRRGAHSADGGDTEPGALVTDTDMCCELRLRRAGAFHYYWLYETESGGRGGRGPAGSGWLQVAPALCAGGRAVPLGAVCCLTALAKCLGPLPRWEGTLRHARESGYNMIHFTPIQELGASDSGYSLADQLKLNPRFSEPGREASFADIDNLLNKMRNEWKMMSICDVVLNHTANETRWLQQHPEAGYSALNTPRLRPAALLDAALARFSTEVSLGHYEHRGIPRRVNEECHLEAIQHVLQTEVVPALQLHELVTCHVDDLLQDFIRQARAKVPPVARADAAAASETEELRLTPDPQWRRLKCRVDMERALQLYNVYWADCYDEEARIRRCSEQLKRRLEQLCSDARDQLDAHLRAAVTNARAGMRYFRVQPDGPRIEEVSEKEPLLPRYFTWPAGALTSPATAEACVLGADGALVLAHNGWVMGGDPLQDFALTGDVYLRRELIAWGDSVKLRYGSKPEDSPFLWAHMREYVELTAELFDGLRLDNCHSTPLHVAEYMLDCARNVKPDLFVVAELFTDSPHVDNMFVNRLGITALIRESMSAWDAHELGRQVHRFSPRSVGAFLSPAPPQPHPARAELPPAVLMDITHDNPCPIDSRSVWDLLPSAALTLAASAAAGSTRGYDELVPHHIHVVEEQRMYPAWGEGGAETGIVQAKRALNLLHQQLAQEGFDEVYVDQMDPDIVAVTRHDPRTRQSVIIVAFTAFHPPNGDSARVPPPLRFEGQLDEILLEAELVHTPGAEYVRSPQYINGLPGYSARLRQRVPLASSAAFRGERRDGEHTVLDWHPWRPGSVVVVRVSLHAEAAEALAQLQSTCTPGVPPPGLASLLQDLTLPDLNVLLYRCDAEERDTGGGVYDIPGYGPLVYAGLQGVASLLAEITPAQDLGHALCSNLRAGDWLPEHMWRRLAAWPRLHALAAWYRATLAPLRRLPRYLHPAYFAGWVHNVHHALLQACIARCSEFVRTGSSLMRALALTSVQLCGELPSASLPPPSPALPPPWPGSTLSAGLPHFATGYMRCWGRDVFVSLRGLLVLTGRLDEARAHLLGFAACLRHGLIPNLLDGGTRARYNCRDAVWWWLEALQQYCAATADGVGAGILRAPVARLFPRDDAAPAPPGCADQPLCDTVQEALDTHFQGLVFRERNAGRGIDAHMTDQGFNVQIGIDPETGFPFGGNEANCGTWCDKMGSSENAGTRGKPATPRDGSAIELVALAYSAATWLAQLHGAGHYPHGGVTRAHRGAASAWTWRQWAERIHNNFERHFWVGEAGDATETRPDLVHRRNIYKDTVGASAPWADYQLRCNMVVALGIAPALCSPRRAWAALDTAQRHLLAPLGLKTLDPGDWNYVGNYDNSDNSTDPKVSHGFNYHQGPEWGWPLGYYLRARLHFAHDNGCYVRTVAAVLAALGPVQTELSRTPWRSLPELYNEGGQPCRDSCTSQAWSTATILEVLHELRAWQRVRPLPVAD